MALSTHERCADAIVAGITALKTAGLLEGCEGVHKHLLPVPDVIKRPAVVVWFNDAEELAGGTNLRDLIGYPVHVALVTLLPGGLKDVPSVLLEWRRIIAKRFRNQRLTAVAENEIVEWRPEKIVDVRQPHFEYLQMAMSFICWCKETRG